MKRIESQSPGNPVIHNQIGVALMRQKKRSEALATFSRSLEIDPDNTEAHVGLGVARRHLGCSDRAVEAHMRSVSLLHHRSQAYTRLRLALAEVNHIERAIRAFRVALGPDLAGAHRCLSRLYQRDKKDPARAIEHAEQARLIEQRTRK